MMRLEFAEPCNCGATCIACREYSLHSCCSGHRTPCLHTGRHHDCACCGEGR